MEFRLGIGLDCWKKQKSQTLTSTENLHICLILGRCSQILVLTTNRLLFPCGAARWIHRPLHNLTCVIFFCLCPRQKSSVKFNHVVAPNTIRKIKPEAKTAPPKQKDCFGARYRLQTSTIGWHLGCGSERATNKNTFFFPATTNQLSKIIQFHGGIILFILSTRKEMHVDKSGTFTAARCKH